MYDNWIKYIIIIIIIIINLTNWAFQNSLNSGKHNIIQLR